MELEEYKKACKVLNDLDAHQEIAYEDYEDDIFFNSNDVTHNLAEGWHQDIQRDGDDYIPQYFCWQADPKDEYCIMAEGYYDSWEGGAIESYEFVVAKIGTRTVTYNTYEEIK